MASQAYYLLPADTVAAESTATVPALTLTEFLDRNALDTVDLLKMDIEGSEFEVLLSTKREVLRRIRRLDLEYHPSRIATKKGLVDFLTDSGFRLVDDTGPSDLFGVACFERVN
jgi:hypothetical protein